MIVYIFSDNYFSKIILPSKISGVYSLHGINDKFLCNIEEDKDHWTIKTNPNIELLDNEHPITTIAVVDFKIGKLIDKAKNVTYFIYATPIYDPNLLYLKSNKNELIIGNGQTCDITYNSPYINNSNIKLTLKESTWYLEASGNNVYVNNKLINNTPLLHGDYIFYMGLKLFLINNILVINNPNNLVKITSQDLSAYQKSSTNEEIETLNIIDEEVSIYDKNQFFFKPPRFTSIIKLAEVKIDEPPEPPKDNDTPVLLVIGPQLTLLATSSISLINYINTYLEGNTSLDRFIISIATISVTVIGALLWPTLTRIFNKKRNKKLAVLRIKKYHEYLEKKKKEIQDIKSKQKQIIIENNIPLKDLEIIINSKDRKLWERSIEDDDFLSIRMGMGQVPTKISIGIPEEKFSMSEIDNLEELHQEIVDESLLISDVPLPVSLVEKNITAIIGNNIDTKNFVDGMFLRMMTLHSYTELKIVVLTNKEKSSNWDYLKILPHCWDNNKNIRYFSNNTDDLNTISIELEKTFDLRVSKDIAEELAEDGTTENVTSPYKDHRPYYLLFIDDVEIIKNNSFLKKVLRYKVNYGFSVLIRNERLATLPSETETFINVSKNGSALITNELSTNNQQEFIADFNTEINMYECAKKLANIPIHVEKNKYELPNSLSFLELYSVGKVEHLNCLEKYTTNNPVNSLSVPIGIDQNGEMFKMDIHEKNHGPHGLVAGTTGSGKSEWIVTYILSLAVNFSPEEIQFVLIDYKGGGLAMSFENAELGIKLPHIAGIITNLDKSAINRSIDSIESELKRRQSVFNAAREKLKEGSMNIYKYQQFYRQKMVDEPMSHLLIICDEFAELKQQQPEFMEQLISTSRIGRSLGVHLILATQKPSGVVNDQIWSNSKFKVCLKVQNQSDSNEILKKPDAAYLKQTGAFYLSVGNDDYFNLGQSAWAGAKYFPSEIVTKKIDQSLNVFDNLGRTITNYDENKKDENIVSKGEELLNVVSYIDSICKKEQLTTRELWLPNVKELTYLNELTTKYNHKVDVNSYEVPIGEYDEPRKQKQGLLKLDLLRGNIGIIGGVGSGKEQLISTLLWSSMIETPPQNLNHYIIDFGSETMKKFSKFPHVGEVVFQDEIDKVAGVLDLINEELNRRKELFSDYNGSFDYYNKYSDKKVPLTTLVINSFDVLLETMPRIDDFMNSLLRDAPKYGIILILSASSSNGIRTRQMQYINNKIITQLQDESMYRTITNCRRGLIPNKSFGRGIYRLGDDDESYVEFQTSHIAPADQVYEYIKSFGNKLLDHYKYKAKELAKIPDTVTSDDLAKYITDLQSVPLGFNFYEKDIAKYDFIKDKINLIISKDLKQNMKSVYGITNILCKIPNTKVRVLDLLNIFNIPQLDIKLFNDKFDEVFAALDNDIDNRTESQPTAINIILGVGQFKKKLSKAGIEITNEFFNKIVKAKNIKFIFIDNYDSLRMLKIEPWFANTNLTNGIWLGQGITSQSLLNVNDLKMEDKKLNFEGIAYTIENSEYKIIKTMLDGEE